MILGMVHATSATEREELERAAKAMGATLEFVSPDERDVEVVVGRVERDLASVADADGAQGWRDEGYWLSPLLCLLALMWFRPGWQVMWE